MIYSDVLQVLVKELPESSSSALLQVVVHNHRRVVDRKADGVRLEGLLELFQLVECECFGCCNWNDNFFSVAELSPHSQVKVVELC